MTQENDYPEYGPRKGLEGPFYYKRSGRVLYYDPKEGQYYDPKTDMYVPNNELGDNLQESDLDEGFVYYGSLINEEGSESENDDGEEYEFNADNVYELECDDCFMVIAIDSDDPYESFGPFVSKKHAEEWINSNEDKFEGVHLVVVRCCPVKNQVEEELNYDRTNEELVIDESEEMIIDESGEAEDGVSHYDIVDTKEKKVVARYRNRRRARSAADKMDEKYGASRYRVDPVRVVKDTTGDQK